jgi:hypothetical protein
LGGFELSFEFLHVAVGMAEASRFAEADAVDDRGVIELIRDDSVPLVEDRFEEAAIRIEARAERGWCRPVCRKPLRRSSSSRWSACVPQMKRTEAMPKLQRSSASRDGRTLQLPRTMVAVSCNEMQLTETNLYALRTHTCSLFR